MKAKLDLLRERIDSLQTRERILLFAAAVAVLWVLAELTLLSPISAQQNKLQHQINQTRAQLNSQQAELGTLTAQTRHNSESPQQLEVNALRQQVAEMQSELTTFTSGMVDAASLPRILEDVLLKTEKLTVLRLTALPVEEMQLTLADNNTLNAGIYKHPVRLYLEGRFFDVLDYLQALEDLPWGFKWDEFHYKVTRFPYAEVELQVYTLTTEEGLFGV